MEPTIHPFGMSSERTAPEPTRRGVVVAGEALIDLLKHADGSLLPHLGGSPWNLARALGRLGCEVSYLNPLSTDDFGEQLAQALLDSRVRCMGGRSALPTSLAVVKLDAQGRPDYAFCREGVADRDLSPLSLLSCWPQTALLFHVGSLAVMPPDGEAWLATLSALAERGICTSIDINMRPQAAADHEAYARMSRQILASGRIVKVSDEDLGALHMPGDPLVQARALLNDVTQVVVLTLGARGAWGLTRGAEIFQPAERVPVVDTVGAGDCFYGGFLAHLIESGALDVPAQPAADQVEQALALGNRVTAFNIQRAGCQPPWRHEL
ncbi:MAG: carbohydrate kinase [Betaproteobacteria bacterium]